MDVINQMVCYVVLFYSQHILELIFYINGWIVKQEANLVYNKLVSASSSQLRSKVDRWLWTVISFPSARMLSLKELKIPTDEIDKTQKELKTCVASGLPVVYLKFFQNRSLKYRFEERKQEKKKFLPFWFLFSLLSGNLVLTIDSHESMRHLQSFCYPYMAVLERN